MKARKALAIVLCVLCCISMLSGCKNRNAEYEIKDDGKYLAGGTIPASSKAYPIVDEDMKMVISYDNSSVDNQLSFEDIWTLNHYIDMFCSFDDTDGDGVKKDEIAKFLTSYTVDEVIKINEEAGSHHKLLGVQVLQIYVTDKNNVKVAYMERATIGDDSTTYDSVGVLYFKRGADGNWYENGIARVETAETGAFKVVRDDITRQLSVVPNK